MLPSSNSAVPDGTPCVLAVRIFLAQASPKGGWLTVSTGGRIVVSIILVPMCKKTFPLNGLLMVEAPGRRAFGKVAGGACEDRPAAFCHWFFTFHQPRIRYDGREASPPTKSHSTTPWR